MKETIIAILTFATEHKLIITGAAGTVAEVIIIFVNMRRRLKKVQERKVQAYMASETPYDGMMALQKGPTKKEYAESFWWSANPINLFRKADIGG